jgi:excisionase family DNA binding protein
MLKRRLTISQTCEVEGIGKTTCYERIHRGEYDSVGEGRLRRITEESIERRRAATERDLSGARQIPKTGPDELGTAA